MNTQAKLFAGGILLVVILVFGFCWKHNADERNTGKIQLLDSTRKVQDTARITAQKKTDSASHSLDTLVRTVVRVDTAWVARKVVVSIRLYHASD